LSNVKQNVIAINELTEHVCEPTIRVHGQGQLAGKANQVGNGAVDECLLGLFEPQAVDLIPQPLVSSIVSLPLNLPNMLDPSHV
jgi:hypothetical protein